MLLRPGTWNWRCALLPPKLPLEATALVPAPLALPPNCRVACALRLPLPKFTFEDCMLLWFVVATLLFTICTFLSLPLPKSREA